MNQLINKGSFFTSFPFWFYTGKIDREANQLYDELETRKNNGLSNQNMDTIVIAAIIGAVATVLSAILTRKYFPERSILPIKSKESGLSSQAYENLSGVWQAYQLTRDKSLSQEPFWINYETKLNILGGKFVDGVSTNLNHPARLQYKIKGEIKFGKMLLTYECIQEPTDFSTKIFPNLLNKERLMGTWIGFDYQRNPVGSSIVLSRQPLNNQELNKLVSISEPNGFIKGGSHPLQPPPSL
ncbi:hypothetical protein ACFLUS_02475 [Chloroflexota bacterium]